MSATVSTWKDGKPVTEVLFEGLVVDQGSTYLGDCDSSYHVVYFDMESGTFKIYPVGYTPVPTTIDAPEDILEAYRLHQEAAKAQARAAQARHAVQQRMYEEAREAALPSRGKTVQVVKGRKVARGTVATVKVYYAQGQYGPSVLLTLADGSEAWTSADNVEVITQEQQVAQAA